MIINQLSFPLFFTFFFFLRKIIIESHRIVKQKIKQYNIIFADLFAVGKFMHIRLAILNSIPFPGG